MSLSSSESELHAMVSTLCDGIFLRRCLEFLTGATLEHYLCTESSSARQLATRQGVGKVKHVSGKLLWVQDVVLNKQVMLVQIPTLWNLSDIGTKPLSAKRLKLVLHELGVSTHDGQYVVGQMEYEQQSARHGGGKEMVVLAKSIARVLVLMGLGPVPSAAVNLEGGDQCSLKEPDTFSTDGEHGQLAFWMFTFFMLAAVIWSMLL